MHIESINRSTPIAFPAATAPTFANRLSRLVEQATQAFVSLASDQSGNTGGGTSVLTPAMLRDALMNLGLPPDTQNMALAEAFAKLGLPLSDKTITEAHVALATASGGTPLAFGLAKALGLPTSPATLNALAKITDGIPVNSALAPEMMDMLSFSLHADMPADALAGQIKMMANQVGRSTENRIAASLAGNLPVNGIQDLRSILLRLKTASRDKRVRIGADTLAAHIEGQQLIAHACVQRNASGGDTPFYFAMPIHFGKEPTMLEMSVWPWHDPDPDEEFEEDTPILRAHIRVATKRLGEIQVEISGTLSGEMTCHLAVDRHSVARLVKQNSVQLAASLVALGWSIEAIECTTKLDPAPLWYGGAALTAPRTRGDWRA